MKCCHCELILGNQRTFVRNSMLVKYLWRHFPYINPLVGNFIWGSSRAGLCKMLKNMWLVNYFSRNLSICSLGWVSQQNKQTNKNKLVKYFWEMCAHFKKWGKMRIKLRKVIECGKSVNHELIRNWTVYTAACEILYIDSFHWLTMGHIMHRQDMVQRKGSRLHTHYEASSLSSLSLFPHL